MKLKGLSKLLILVITTNDANRNLHLLQNLLPKIPPINDISSEIVPPGTATALPAAVTPYDQSKHQKFKQFNGPKKVSCRFCGPTSTHNTFQCELSIQDRISAVKSKQLCFNCRRGGHATTQCQYKFRCSVCRQPHLTTLHGASGLQ